MRVIHFIVVSILVKLSVGICRESHLFYICDNLRDISHATYIPEGQSHVIVGKEDTFTKLKWITAFDFYLDFRNVKWVMVINQLKAIKPPKDIRPGCTYQNNLEYLTFYRNEFKILGVDLFFPDNLVLRELNLQYNNVRQIITNTFQHSTIHTINLSNNNLEVIETDAFSNANKVIYLRNNNISHMEQRAFPEALEELYLDNNDLYSIQNQVFDSLKELLALSLAMNKLSVIPNDFSGLTSLKLLNMSHNKLEYIGVDSFVEMPKLAVLDLSFNRIRKLADTDSLFHNRKYMVVSLTFNRLTELKFPNSSDTSLKTHTLMLYGNPWICSEWERMAPYIRWNNLRWNECDARLFSGGTSGTLPFCIQYQTPVVLPSKEPTLLQQIDTFQKSIDFSKIDCQLRPSLRHVVRPDRGRCPY